MSKSARPRRQTPANQSPERSAPRSSFDTLASAKRNATRRSDRAPNPRPRIALAQNFLRDPRLVDRLLAQSSIGPEDVVCEIGPGTGMITDRLSERCRHVVAIERDQRLADVLRRRFTGRPNITLFASDFLDFPSPVTPYKVFANVPFNVTAAIVGKLTAVRPAPDDLYLVVQKEAAHRFLGQPAETLYSLLLKPWFAPTVLHQFARSDFIPEPGVDVVLMRLRKRGPPLVAERDAQRYRDFVTYGFTAWKPTVRAAYADVLDRRVVSCVQARVGADLRVNPSQLPLAQWLALFACFQEQADHVAKARVVGAEQRVREQQRTMQKEHRTRKQRPR